MNSRLCILCLLVCACGARSGHNEAQSNTPTQARDATSGQACAMPPAFVSQFCRLASGRCAVGGIAANGDRYEMTCDASSCVMTVNARRTCQCTRPDFANTCPNAIPMCADWLLPLDFSTLNCVRDMDAGP